MSNPAEREAATDAELEARYPQVPWRAPFLVPGQGLVCRYCLALNGFVPREFFDGESGHQNHLDRCHRE